MRLSDFVRPEGVPSLLSQEQPPKKRRITADTALRQAKYFGTSAEFRLGLQSQYDLDIVIDALTDRSDREVKEYSDII